MHNTFIKKGGEIKSFLINFGFGWENCVSCILDYILNFIKIHFYLATGFEGP